MRSSLKLVISMSACLIFTAGQIASAAEGDHQRAVARLIQASYVHLELAQACRSVLGASTLQDARVLIENAIRATGLPTDIALQTAAELSEKAASAAETMRPPNANDCLTRYAISVSTVARARSAAELQR